MPPTNTAPQISSAWAFIMIGVALCFDGVVFFINFIPFIGQIISIGIGFIAYLTFWLWFTLKGVRMMTPKRAAAMGTGFLVSLIPILNMLPEITISVVITIASTRIKVPGQQKI